jgi:hypothetical protein
MCSLMRSNRAGVATCEVVKCIKYSGRMHSITSQICASHVGGEDGSAID